MLDENVPIAVADMLTKHGHKAEFIRDYVLPGSPDPLVATVSQGLDAVLISFDGDFRKIAPRIPDGQRTRFRKLSRIEMRCNFPQGASRLEGALEFVSSEFKLAKKRSDVRMQVCIGTSFLRTNR